MWYFVDAFQNSYAIIIVMKASYKEAGKTRKWLFSVLATIVLVFSFVTPSFVTTQGSAYADSSIDEVDESVQTDKDDDDVTCMNSGAGKSLGWILCPVLDLLTNTAEKTYNSIIKPSMNIESDLFDQSKAGAGTHSAWSVFQGIANVAFVILFMVVIVSQVTGIGINNYGIKKILPKLIVVAILVNISWYICVIATDVSNIIGNSIQELFEHLPTTADGEAASITLATVSGGERAINIAAKGTLNSVAILGAVAGIGAIIINPAILLSLLISALGVVISVFTLFVLLSARQALVVVLTVISPVAIVCFMLPNTKKIFDRWLKISEGMLLVYPICGLLVGGGDYVSKLLLTLANQGGFFIVLTAMIVGIVPIFFIPTVLKKSFAAAGDIGAKISGYGQRVSHGAQRSIRDSNAYKQTATRMNAGVNRSGNLTGLGKARAKIAESRMGRSLGMDRAMAGSLAQAKKNQEASNAAGAMLLGASAREGIAKAAELDAAELGNGFAAGQEGAYYGRMFIEAAEKGNETQMSSAIEAMRNSNMKPKDIAKLVRYAENKGKLNFNGDSNARAAWLRDLSKNYGNDFLSTDMELATWAKTGGSYGKSTMTRLGDFGEYASGSGMIGNDDVKPEDIARLSGDSLAAMAVGKQLNSSMAKSVLASSPNLSADKKIMLSAIAGGATVTDANLFKEQAKALMNADDAAFANSGQTKVNSAGVKEAAIEVGGKLWTRAERDAMTSAQPRTVNIVDIDGNGLIVPHGGGGGGTPPTPPPAPTGGNGANPGAGIID